MTTARLTAISAAATVVATASGLTPYRNLDLALEDRRLPAISLESGPEQYDPEMSTINREGFVASFNVDILVARSADPEAAADAIEEDVHAALVADRTLGGTCQQLRRVGGNWDFSLGDCARRTLTYQLQYTS